jgi:Zn-dependent protease with chaperone function
MYDQQFNSISAKIESLSKKADLNKVPKLKRHKELVPLAYYNGALNRLSVSEKLLEQWQKGIYTEETIDGILAHEIGHAIGHQRKSHHNKQIIIHLLLLAVILIVLSVGWSTDLGIIQLIVSFASIFALVFWAFRLPKLVRQVFVLSELEADKNAVTFNLIDARQLAKINIQRINIPKSVSELSTFETISYLWNICTHPSLVEIMLNLNCRIKEPVEIIENSEDQG